MHSDYDPAETDSDLEDGELRKMLASPHVLECQSQRGNLLHVTEERGQFFFNGNEERSEGRPRLHLLHALSSRSEAAKARAAAQPKMDPHLVLHACSTRYCKMGGSDLAFALANKDKNRRVSPTNAPKPRPRGRPTEPCDVVPQAWGMFSPSGDVPPAAQRHPHSGMWRTVTVQRRNQRGVDCQLRSPEEGQFVPQDLHTPLIRWIWSSQIEVAEHRIGHDTASCAPQHFQPQSPVFPGPCSGT